MKTKWNHWRHSFHAKILISFCILFLLFAGSSWAGYSMALKIMYRLTIESMESTLKQVNTDTSTILVNVQNRAVEVSEDMELQSLLRKELPETMEGVYKERLNVNNKLYYSSIQVKHIDSLYIVGDNGALFRSTYSYGLRKQEYREDTWYQVVMDTGDILWIEPHAGSFLGNNLDFETISIAVPIADKASTRHLGVVVADVLVENLHQIQNNTVLLGGSICILNENKEVIYMDSAKDGTAAQPEVQAINEALHQSPSIPENKFLSIGGQDYLVSFLDLSDSKWTLMCLVQTEQVVSQVKELRNMLVAVSLLIAILGIVFSFYSASRLVKPIQALQQGMKEVEKGDFTVRVEADGHSEIVNLASGFNHMISRVNELVENERAMQEKLKQADFNALQAQINPHFLYNTLDSIGWMARMNRADKVEEMLGSLTSFLRIGLSRGRVFISLEEELKHVESYISIQKIRYQRLLNYSIDVPDGLRHYSVIKMILQPLVENALDHGIREKDAPGLISITGKETEDRLILSVADDGQGMTQERLAQVREMMENGVAQNQDAYGIINVQRRIQSYFGKEYGLTFDSEYTKGTQVTIILPKQEDQNNHV